jgi:hypothetical protein
MKTTNMKCIGLLCLAVLACNVLQAQVKSDYDKETDFSQFNTYTFAGWQNDSDKILNDFDKKRILDALKTEFTDRGMNLVESGGDAIITLYVVVEGKTSTTAYTNYNAGLGYTGRWGWGMGMGVGATATTNYTQNDYEEGTLVIDMYDEESKHLVWQGILQAEVQEKPEKRDKSIPKKISKLMKEYPVRPVN